MYKNINANRVQLEPANPTDPMQILIGTDSPQGITFLIGPTSGILAAGGSVTYPYAAYMGVGTDKFYFAAADIANDATSRHGVEDSQNYSVQGASWTTADQGGGIGPTVSLSVAGGIASSFILTYSDERLKTDISPLTSVLDDLQLLQPVWYRWKANPGLLSAGLIAQQVLPIFPETVKGSSESHYVVDYQSYTAILIRAVQELTERVKVLESGCNCSCSKGKDNVS